MPEENKPINIKTEAIAGITTFLTMAYIVILNPVILSTKGTGITFTGALTATVLVCFTMTLLMGLYAKLPFDPVSDLVPLAQFVQGAFAVVVATNSPFKTIQELISEAKRQPGTISYASAGVGSPTHMAGAQFGHMAGINIVHIPYKDASQVMTDVIGGQLQMGLTGTSTAMSMIQGGKLRALAVTGSKRVPALANVPTLDESGVRGYDVTSPIFAVTRAGTPAATVSEISRILLEAANTPEFKEVADRLGYVMDLQDAAKMRSNMPSEFAKWKRMVDISGAKPG